MNNRQLVHPAIDLVGLKGLVCPTGFAHEGPVRHGAGHAGLVCPGAGLEGLVRPEVDNKVLQCTGIGNKCIIHQDFRIL